MLVVALALIGSVFCAGLLLFVRFAHWAGAHPFAGTLLIVLAVPVPYMALRAMPRARPPARTYRQLARWTERGMIKRVRTGRYSASHSDGSLA
ncbi:hypothetical protein [Streptomyces sp. NPDC057889]|uniref:hypothetical protein n=1 Tax=unclassified Streptomyces TaxID=2593676 RepID=UPI003685B995